VATAAGGTPEAVEDGGSGYLVAPGDGAALAERILRLLRSDAERAAFGARGRQRVREDFTFDAQAAQYRRLFEQLAGRCRQAEEAACPA
jgi:glycosyltransferase involved in cell wall biosynthesis